MKKCNLDPDTAIVKNFNLRGLLLATLAGVLLALSMPKPGWWPLAWIGLAPLLIAVHNSRPRIAALYGLVCGAIYYGIILFWLTLFGYLPWFGVALLNGALPIAIFAAMASILMSDRARGWSFLAVPAAWTAIQYARSLGPLGFTWGSLAHTQADFTSIIQMATLTGAWGIDFILCLCSLALATSATANKPRRSVTLVIATIVSAVAILGGYTTIHSAKQETRPYKIALIQANIPQDAETTPNYLSVAFTAFSDMSRQAAISKPDYIVWPETTLPVRISGVWDQLIYRLVRETRCNYAIGGYSLPSDPSEARSYNSAHFFSKEGAKQGCYNKVRLVPYGEYVPLRKQLPFLSNYGIRPVDVLEGESYLLVDSAIGKVGVNICFESLFPQISRLETRNGAVVLFILTNDAWFGRSQAARAHMMMAKLRAVENRRYVVRAAATGISTFIDPYGRQMDELDIYKKGILTENISAKHALTPYTIIADAFPILCAAAVILTLAALCLKRPHVSN